MTRIKIVEFLNKYYLQLVFLCMAGIFALGLVVVVQRPMDLTEGGSSTWWMITQNVEQGRGYKACEETYIPNCALTDQTTAIREPLPVFFYVIIGKLTHDSPLAFQLSQIFLNMMICWFVFRLAEELGNRMLGLVAAFGWAFFLPTLRVEAHISGDLIASLFVVTSVIGFIRAIKSGSLKAWVGFGVLSGLAVLSRSSTLLISAALLAGAGLYLLVLKRLFTARAWLGLIAAGLALGLTVSPWVIRNTLVFGKPILGTTLVGYNLYRHNAIVVTEVFPHYVGSDEGYQEIAALVERTPALRTPINEAQVDEIFQNEALKLISAHREDYVELVLFRFVPLWFNIGVLEQYGQTMLPLDYVVVFEQAVLLLVFLFAIWKGDWFLRLLAFSVPVFMFGYLAIDSQLRYMIPAMPLVIAIGVAGLGHFSFSRIRNN